MSKAIAFSRHYASAAYEPVRVALVGACGLALIAAGQALPLAL